MSASSEKPDPNVARICSDPIRSLFGLQAAVTLKKEYFYEEMCMEILGFCLGILGFLLGSVALSKITKLEAQLKKSGVLDKDFTSE